MDFGAKNQECSPKRSKMEPRGCKMTQKGSKMDPQWSRKGPKWSQKDPKWNPKGAKRSPKGSKGVPKGSQKSADLSRACQSTYWGEVSSPLPPSALGTSPPKSAPNSSIRTLLLKWVLNLVQIQKSCNAGFLVHFGSNCCKI